MPSDLFCVSVDWYGPIEDLKASRKVGRLNEVEECIYIAFEPAGRMRSYVGVTKAVSGRLVPSHHVLGSWKEGSYQIWLGVITSQPDPDSSPTAKPAYHSEALKFAERMAISFIEPTENDRGTATTPKRSGTLLNRWFRLDDQFTRWESRPHRNWPDFIEYEKDEKFARNVFFGGHVERFEL